MNVLAGRGALFIYIPLASALSFLRLVIPDPLLWRLHDMICCMIDCLDSNIPLWMHAQTCDSRTHGIDIFPPPQLGIQNDTYVGGSRKHFALPHLHLKCTSIEEKGSPRENWRRTPRTETLQLHYFSTCNLYSSTTSCNIFPISKYHIRCARHSISCLHFSGSFPLPGNPHSYTSQTCRELFTNH